MTSKWESNYLVLSPLCMLWGLGRKSECGVMGVEEGEDDSGFGGENGELMIEMEGMKGI